MAAARVRRAEAIILDLAQGRLFGPPARAKMI
jgi:hypothetical protein